MIKDQKAEVIAVSPATPWEGESLIEASDTVLSAAVQNLPEDIGEPSKTVFGVPPSWVSEGQIKEEFLSKIKKICIDLSLEPSGFVVLPEAFAHLTKSEEGTPLNAIVMGITSEALDITVFNLGNMVGSTSVARSVSIADDVVEGLTRFKISDNLPSRFLIYDGKEGDLEDSRQALLNIHWEEQKGIKFLHTPKVEIISPEKKVLATALAGASEIASITSIEEVDKDEQNESPIEPQERKIEAPQAAPDNFGFVVNQDISENKTKTTEEQTQTNLETPPFPSNEQPLIKKSNILTSVANIFRSTFSNFKNMISLQKRKLPGLTSTNLGSSQSKKTLIIGTTFLAVLIVGFLAFWWFYPRAEVVIYISPQKLSQQSDLSIDTSGSSDIDNLKIAGEEFSTQVSGDKTQPTSGSKKIGEKAKGTVKIQNGTASIVNLKAGTELVSSGNLSFTLDSSASISAALSPSDPGVTNVDATAAVIGSEYNVAKDESFKVGNYPKADLDAKALSDFSGGSSRDITAVSQEDQTTLENALTNELLQNALEEGKSSVGNEKLLIENSLTSKVDSKEFSNKVGDEADTLKLSLTLSIKGVVVKKSDLLDLANKVLKDKIPQGFVLRENQISASFDLKGEKDGLFSYKTNLSANLLPEVKIEDITKKIAGRSKDNAQKYLTSISGFSRAEITLKPTFPGPFRTLPHVSKNIEVTLQAEK